MALEGVLDVLKSMTTGNKEVSLTISKEWIKNEYNTGLCLKSVKDVICKPQNIWSSEQEQERIIVLLNRNLFTEERCQHLIEMLVLQMYPYKKAAKIVHNMREQLEYCTMLYISSQITLEETPAFFTLHNAVNCLELIMIPIASILFSGMQAVIAISKEHPLAPFYCYLRSLFIECGLPAEALVIGFEESPTRPLPSSISCCPFFVFNDGDIDSAVDSAVSAICDKIYEVPWSLSHIYIQEGIYPTFVKLLKQKFKSTKFGSRFDQFIDCDFQFKQNQVPQLAEFQIGSLDIFEPVENFPVKLCFGWNPADTDMDENLQRFCLPVLSFRTIPEALNIIDKYPEEKFLTAWTGSVSTEKKISMVKFSTIWINCHAEFDPSVPVHIEDTPYFDFMKFSQFLVKRKLFEKYESQAVCGIKLNKPIKEHSCASDTKTAIAKAKKAASTWDKTSAKLKIWNFMELMKNKRCIPDDILSKIASQGVLRCHNPAVTAHRSPTGIVVFPIMGNLYSELFDLLVASVSNAIVAGNVIILMGVDASTISFAVMVADMFSSPHTEGLVTAVTEEIKFNECGLSDLVSLKPFSVTDGNFIEKPVYTYYSCPSFLGSLLERNTFVWSPV